MQKNTKLIKWTVLILLIIFTTMIIGQLSFARETIDGRQYEGEYKGIKLLWEGDWWAPDFGAKLGNIFIRVYADLNDFLNGQIIRDAIFKPMQLENDFADGSTPKEGFNFLKGVGLALLPLVLLRLAFAYLTASVNPMQRSEFKDLIKYTVLYIAILVGAEELIKIALNINNAIVEEIGRKVAIDVQTANVGQVAFTLLTAILGIIVAAYVWVISMYINIIFLIRRITLDFCYMLLPIAGALMFFPKFRDVINKLYSEILALIFKQTAFAICFFLLYKTLIQIFVVTSPFGRDGVGGFITQLCGNGDKLGPFGWALLATFLVKFSDKIIDFFGMTSSLAPKADQMIQGAASKFKDFGESKAALGKLTDGTKLGKFGEKLKELKNKDKNKEPKMLTDKDKDKDKDKNKDSLPLGSPKNGEIGDKNKDFKDASESRSGRIKNAVGAVASYFDPDSEASLFNRAEKGSLGSKLMLSGLKAGSVLGNAAYLGVGSSVGYQAFENAFKGAQHLKDMGVGRGMGKKIGAAAKEYEEGYKERLAANVPVSKEEGELLRLKDGDKVIAFSQGDQRCLIKQGQDGSISAIKQNSEGKMENIDPNEALSYKANQVGGVREYTFNGTDNGAGHIKLNAGGVKEVSRADGTGVCKELNSNPAIKVDPNSATSLIESGISKDAHEPLETYLKNNPNADIVKVAGRNGTDFIDANGDHAKNLICSTSQKNEALKPGQVEVAKLSYGKRDDGSEGVFVGNNVRVSEDQAQKLQNFISGSTRVFGTNVNGGYSIKGTAVESSGQAKENYSLLNEGEKQLEVVEYDNASGKAIKKFYAIDSKDSLAEARPIGSGEVTKDDIAELEKRNGKFVKVHGIENGKLVTDNEYRDFKETNSYEALAVLNYRAKTRSNNGTNKEIKAEDICLSDKELKDIYENPEYNYISIKRVGNKNAITAYKETRDPNNNNEIIDVQETLIKMVEGNGPKDTYINNATSGLSKDAVGVYTIEINRDKSDNTKVIGLNVTQEFADFNDFDASGINEAFAEDDVALYKYGIELEKIKTEKNIELEKFKVKLDNNTITDEEMTEAAEIEKRINLYSEEISSIASKRLRRNDYMYKCMTNNDGNSINQVDLLNIQESYGNEPSYSEIKLLQEEINKKKDVYSQNKIDELKDRLADMLEEIDRKRSKSAESEELFEIFKRTGAIG